MEILPNAFPRGNVVQTFFKACSVKNFNSMKARSRWREIQKIKIVNIFLPSFEWRHRTRKNYLSSFFFKKLFESQHSSHFSCAQWKLATLTHWNTSEWVYKMDTKSFATAWHFFNSSCQWSLNNNSRVSRFYILYSATNPVV